MAKSRKKKSNLLDTQAAVDVLSEELRTGQLRYIPQNPDHAHIHLPARRAKRPRASKKKRMTKAQEIITANKPLPLAPVSTRPKRVKCNSSTRLAAPRCMVEERPVEQASVRADAWAAVDSTSNWIDHHAVAARPKSMDVHNRAQIPAVEIDPGGCSYNPDKELHQDVLAQAVADEYLKEIDKELRPKPPPMAVMEDEVGLQEMAIGLFEDDDDSSDDDVLCEERQESRSEKQNQDKKTLKDRVRQQRHREMEKKHVSKRELKRLRREIDSLPQLCGSLTENDQALAARRARRQADVEDRQAREPPKLGRLKFIPQPTQVLATDDVTGSLRKLKTVPVIANDRFKSLQKRGIIHVTTKQHWLKPSTRRVKRYEKKATQEKYAAKQQEIRKINQQRRRTERGSSSVPV